MVLLWKKYENNVKGIIIFTHKEINNSFIPFSNIQNKYYIGLHIGCWFINRHIPDYIDFIMCSPNQLNIPTNKMLIPYNSRNFLPTYFDKEDNKSKEHLINSINKFKEYSTYPLPINLIDDIINLKEDKYWDIITVAKPHHVKKLDCFLISMKQILDININIKILIISAIAPNEAKHIKDHHNIIEIIRTNFTELQQNQITLLRPECNTNEGINNEFILPFYQWSKIFCFFTEFEGESRVTSEGLCSGLPIVCYKYLKGGAADYLNESNSIQFEKYEDAYISIIKCIDNYKELNTNYIELQNILRVDKSINVIKEEFKKLYKNNRLEFNNELIEYDQLHFRLPGHYYYDPWAEFSDNETSDILNNIQWNIFLKHNPL